MKKLFSILLIVVLIFSMTCVVAGETADSATSEIDYDDIDGGSATTSATVTLTLEELFTVTLPTSFVLELNDDKNAYADAEPLSVNVIRLDSGHSLEIYVSSINAQNNEWRLLKGSIGDNNAFVPDGSGAHLVYLMGIGTETSHVGETGNTALVSTGNDLVAIAKDIRTNYNGYYIHAKTNIPASGSIDSAVYQDQLTFTVKLNTGN